MKLIYHQARFLISAAKLLQAPPDEGLEVAFAGRSNAGKSSAINVLCNQKELARTSKTPGRTQLLNFFILDKTRRLVDLPGYGYASVAEEIKQRWQAELAAYLEQRKSLRGIVLLMDIRHPLKAYDRRMLEWSRQIGISVHILLTKADKLNRGAVVKSLNDVEKALKHNGFFFTVQPFSALKRQGLSQVHEVMDKWFEINS